VETLTTLLLAVLILSVWGLIGAVIWLALRSRSEDQPQHIAVLQAEMKALREQVSQNLGAMTQQVAVFGSVQEGIGQVSAATNKILELGQDITALQNILSAPKPRGGLGEIMLGNLRLL